METLRTTRVCPLLLCPTSYEPDSVNLLKDEEARNYWLNCLEAIGQQFVNKADYLHKNDSSAIKRAEKCRDDFNDVLCKLKANPTLVEELSVRTLLDLNEQIVREYDFTDAWQYQKTTETTSALQSLQSRLCEINNITTHKERWLELSRGVLAGNMFDWGAKAVLELFDNSDNFGLSEALSKIQPRPWLVDDLDKFIKRLEGPPYKCVVIFVDNAGIDLVLGIMPFAVEFLKCGSKVICCSNSKPALNDVTHKECEMAFNFAIRLSEDIEQAIKNNKLLFFESGGEGPCLDLRNLNPDLCEAMTEADLVILEGMGRAVHTNLYAQFKVDCLKVAVVKNEWWATRLGGDKFSVLFKFEPANTVNCNCTAKSGVSTL